MKTMKKVVAAISLAAVGLGMTACTDEQIAVGTGIAAGAIIGSELSRHDHGYDRGYHRPPPPPRYRPGYPGYGRPGYGGPGYGRPGYGRPGYGPRPGFPHHGFAAVQTAGNLPEEQTAILNLMEKYSLSDDAAEVLAGPLVQVKNGDMSALSKLGLSQADVMAMAQDQNPSAQVLKTLSEKMNLSLGETHQVIQLMKADIISALK